MHITNPKIEDYCRRHSARTSAERRELEKHTREHCEMPQMVVGELVGSVLQFLVAVSGARRVLEVGCFTGYSALAMAEALPADGELVSLDVDEETNRIARDFWAKSPHGAKIRPILGDAHETLRSLDGPFDLVFIDADKVGYRDYVDASLELLSANGLIVLDNSLLGGGVLTPELSGPASRAVDELNAYVAGREDLQTVLLPVRDGLMLVRRTS